MAVTGKQDKDNSIKTAMEELAALRQKCGSLSMRGNYAECAELIENNLAFLYFKERWPENFLGALQLHKRCFASLNYTLPYEEYILPLLKKNGIPYIFSGFLQSKPPSWNSEYFMGTALSLRKSGEYEEALAYAELFVKTDPRNTNSYLIKGWILEDLGRGTEALSQYGQALEMNAQNRQASESIALYYLKSDPKKGLEFITGAISEAPSEAIFFALKAKLLEKLGRRSSAMEALDEAAVLDPYQADYPYEKGELLTVSGKGAAALAQYRRAAVLNPKHIPCLARLAALCADSQPVEALGYSNSVVSAEPGNIPAALLRARLLARTGDSPNAIREYKRILEMDENNFDALTGLGGLYLRLDPSAALGYYDLAVSISPKSAVGHMGRAKALEAQGNLSMAADAYKAVVSLDRHSAEAFASLGRLYNGSNPDSALDYYDRAIRISPEKPDYHAQKAEILLTSSKKDKAIESLILACTYDNGNAALHLRLADLFYESGNHASALARYREAVSLDPALPDARFGVASLTASTEPHTALGHINAALRLDFKRARFYSLKSRIISRLVDDRYALSRLETLLGPKTDDETREEITALLKGDSKRLALEAINQAIELEPQNNVYLCERANLLYDMGQHTKALGQYKQLLAADPQNPDALFGMGKILARKKDAKALEYFDKVIALSPKIAAYHAAKAAFLAMDEEKYIDAVNCYDTAIPLDTYAWEPVFEKAVLQDNHGDRFGAMASYRRTLLIYHDCLPAASRMGQLLSEEKPLAALEYLKHAAKLDPYNWEHPAWTGRVLYGLGRTDDGEKSCRTAIELAAGASDIAFKLAGILRDPLPETALEYCDIAIRRNPSDSGCRLLKGDVYLRLGDRDMAMQFYREAIELDNRCHDAYMNMAKLLYEDKSPDALAMADSSLKVRPKCPDCLLLKTKILDEVCEPPQSAQAVECATRAVKLFPESLDLREKLVELLQKNRMLLRYPIEKLALERLRRANSQLLAKAADTQEISFEQVEQAEPARKLALDAPEP